MGSRIATVLRRPKLLALDTFTDANGTGAAAHAPDLGPAWVVLAGTWEIQGDRLRKTLDNGVHQALVQDLGRTDLRLAVEITVPAGGYASVGVRVQDQDNGWMVQLDDTGAPDNMKIFERSAGVFYQRAVLNSPLGGTHRVEVDCRGSEIAARLDGGNEIRYEGATAFAGATQFGPWGYTANAEWDNWEVRS